MRTIIGTITGATGIAILALATASPAVAATLPAGDAVYILPCDSQEFDGQLFSVDTSTGAATRVGDWVNPDTDLFPCAGPGAYNPVNGLGYWIGWGGGAGKLNSVDLTTGVSTHIGDFTLEGEPYYTPIALAIDGAGNAWASSWSISPDVLFSVNLATAELTVVGPTGVTAESENYGLAWDSVTGMVYGYNTSTTDFYTVNTTTGAFTLFNDDVFTDVVPYAIAFDSAGQVWGIDGDIVSAPLSDLDNAQFLTVLNPIADAIYSESIIIVPAAAVVAAAPALADTGVADTGVVAAGVAGLLLLVAGAFMTRRRTQSAR